MSSIKKWLIKCEKVLINQHKNQRSLKTNTTLLNWTCFEEEKYMLITIVLDHLMAKALYILTAIAIYIKSFHGWV